MLTGAKVYGEGNIFVAEHVPTEAVERVAFEAGDAKAFPTQTLRLPGLATQPISDHRVKADE